MPFASKSFVVRDRKGNAVSGAHVEVRAEEPGASLAALYSDRLGTVEITNPFDTDTDSDGTAHFFVKGGAYRIMAYIGPRGSPKFKATLRYEAIGLNSESDGISSRTHRTVTVAGPVTVEADDADIIVINKTVGAATAVTLPLSASRTKPVMIVDGKGDANTNNIAISPQTGERIYGVTNGAAVIDGNGGSVILTPLAAGTGWF